MTIELSEYAARVVTSQVNEGRYATPAAAVDAALARLTTEASLAPTAADKLEALHRLQANMNLSSQDVERWQESVSVERQARVLPGDRGK